MDAQDMVRALMAAGITQKRLAGLMAVSVKNINWIANGRVGVVRSDHWRALSAIHYLVLHVPGWQQRCMGGA